MGTRERHIGNAAARSAPVADPRGGRLFAMPRFLVGITHQVYRHRVFAIAGVITAMLLMLLAVLPALFAFDPKLSNAVPAYSEVSEEVVDALVHSSSLPLLVAAIAFSIWGVSVYLRCLDYVLRRRLVAIATICALWMIEVILKYKSFTPFYATVLWYLYYVPMTLIPLLYQLCGLRLAGLEQHRLGRRYCAALWIVAILLIGFVLTNDFHQQVFHFDRTSDTWSNDYAYGWGYFAVLVWTAFNFVAFFILVGRSSSFRIQRFSGTAALVLLGGEPGIGKSTLSLQIALADNGLKTLYVSGEESAEQIKMRADRIGIGNDACMVYSETLLENIMAQLEEQRPDLVIIDSIQTIYTDLVESSAGSVSQIRECAATLLKYAKGSGTSIFIIGHITKEGAIAGPKILEHIVDVVLQFEGDNNQVYRILRGIKNRFGATFEIGVFEMLDAGLRPVGNPSEILLTHYDAPLSGIAVGASVDGIRPYLIEVQALVSNAAYGTPQRTATGFDYKRMSMLLAVLEKRVGMKMYTKDVFLNFAGGFKVADPGLDLAIIAAVISSYYDRPIGEGICCAGEVGLSGEVRPAPRTEQRISEAARLGFRRIVVSGYLPKGAKRPKGIEVVAINSIDQLPRALFINEE